MAWAPGRRIMKLALVFVLVSSGGCMGFLHPVAPEAVEHAKACPQLPQECRQHVYVFFVTGMDPLDYANLHGVRDFLNDIDYPKTYTGQLYHVGYFAEEIRRIHQVDPEARFVLLGFSFGANAVRDIASNVGKDAIPIDLLVYCGGNTLKDCPEDQPANAIRILNFLANGCVWNGDHLSGATNEYYGDVWHFGSVTHLKTLEILVDELAVVAARVPVNEFPDDPGPHPARVVPPMEKLPRDDWDFLKLPAPGQPVLPPPVPQAQPAK
jgi:hypothetical protein